MILVLLAICVALIAVGVIILRSNSYYDESAGVPFIVIGVLSFVVTMIGTVVLLHNVSQLYVIDEKIEMYQSENAVIETQIIEIVEEYQKYETDIFTELSPESAITYASLYPELKSDTLVQQQIEVYVSNNQKIKELKEQKISGKVTKWWLYFGGGK